MMVCVSCSDDDVIDDDNGEIEATPLTEIEKNIVGGWPELGENGVTFLQNDLIAYDGKVGHWQYDETSKTLTTDILNSKKQALIWQITMLQEGSMAGIQLWDGKTFAAQRNVEQAMKDILFNRSWTRDKTGKLLVLEFSGNCQRMKYKYVEHSNWKYGISYDYGSSYDNDLTVQEQDFTSIVLASKEYGEHIIHNPYDYDKVWFEFPGELKYYPVTDGMTNIKNVKMSKQESMLVGKWICQEQIIKEWNGNFLAIDETNRYFDGEYGMEFTDGFWGKMWSGGDQLMEVMGRDEFSWWIKDDKLYRDNNTFYILKLTDKEMELEWRDVGLTITCKFYKYNEDEGFLIDQMEYVDLGLSVKWATHNLGAEDRKASQLGNYYAWGETSPKDVYILNNYKYCRQLEDLWLYFLTKYNSDPDLGYNGFVDGKTTLDAEDDAAIAVRGKEWRMPTPEEFQELVDKCTWVWTQDAEGNSGYKVTGTTGYYIFLPAAGYKVEDAVASYSKGMGCYLTNSTGVIPSTYADYPFINCVHFSQSLNPKTNKDYFSLECRAWGYSIRPVRK
ncbi:MAG: hypothetical protein Q4F50_07980 [Bacteroides sp.]|uniref:hypothetical protein n=1 Tax=Bacteroides sp. TaxID=29523 RepID=UPI0026DEFC51|nr:hypothetical protein [Bacteroides sp.]MDO5419982.1 hypothetical protein [Bacteroides sp.]